MDTSTTNPDDGNLLFAPGVDNLFEPFAIGEH